MKENHSSPLQEFSLKISSNALTVLKYTHIRQFTAAFPLITKDWKELNYHSRLLKKNSLYPCNVLLHKSKKKKNGVGEKRESKVYVYEWMDG